MTPIVSSSPSCIPPHTYQHGRLQSVTRKRSSLASRKSLDEFGDQFENQQKSATMFFDGGEEKEVIDKCDHRRHKPDHQPVNSHHHYHYPQYNRCKNDKQNRHKNQSSSSSSSSSSTLKMSISRIRDRSRIENDDQHIYQSWLASSSSSLSSSSSSSSPIMLNPLSIATNIYRRLFGHTSRPRRASLFSSTAFIFVLCFCLSVSILEAASNNHQHQHHHHNHNQHGGNITSTSTTTINMGSNSNTSKKIGHHHQQQQQPRGPPPPQKFEMEPIDKTAIVGDTVILPCRVENKVGTLQWTRDGFGLGTERTLDGFQRYRMVGSDDEGDFSLEISPVSLEDDATFQCQVGALDGVQGIRSRSASFTVQTPPEPPVIVVTHANSHAQIYKSTTTNSGADRAGNNSARNFENSPESSPSLLISASATPDATVAATDHRLRTTAGATIEFTCEAHAGKPPAELTWMDSAGNVITEGVTYSTTKLLDNKRWNAALKWTVVASRALDGERVTCRSENAALKSARYANIEIEVRYAPEVRLRIATHRDESKQSNNEISAQISGGEDVMTKSGDDENMVREGDDLALECRATGNPARMTFKWSRDGVPLGAEGDVGASGDGTPRLVFRRVGREFHRTQIACEVANAVGTSRATLEIRVAFRPRFRKTPEAVIGISRGETVRLRCDVDSFPPARIAWSRFTLRPNPDSLGKKSGNFAENSISAENEDSGARFIEHWQPIGVDRNKLDNDEIVVARKQEDREEDGANGSGARAEVINGDDDDDADQNSAWIDVRAAGRYRCVGKSVAFDDELKGETLVFLKGAPLIRSPSVQYGIENEPVRLQCMVEAIPPPTKITWFKLKPHQQILGVDNNEGYEILEEEDPDDYSILPSIQLASASTPSSPSSSSSSSSSSASSSSLSSSASYLTASTLTAPGNDVDEWPLSSSLSLLRSIIYIRRAKESDFGQYNCSVWNQYGFQSQIITLQKQANILSPLVLTLSGIFGIGILFVLIASLIVFACIRSQRLRAGHLALTPKKLTGSRDDTSGSNNLGNYRTGNLIPAAPVTTASNITSNGHCAGPGFPGSGSILGYQATTANPNPDLAEKTKMMMMMMYGDENSSNSNSNGNGKMSLKNTILKLNDPNGRIITASVLPPDSGYCAPANHSHVIASSASSSLLPVYSEYEYNYAYPAITTTNNTSGTTTGGGAPPGGGEQSLIIANGITVNSINRSNNGNNNGNNNNCVPPVSFAGYDNNIGGAYHNYHDYAIADAPDEVEKISPINGYVITQADNNNIHLYSKVIKPHHNLQHSQQQQAQQKTAAATGNYSTLLRLQADRDRDHQSASNLGLPLASTYMAANSNPNNNNNNNNNNLINSSTTTTSSSLLRPKLASNNSFDQPQSQFATMNLYSNVMQNNNGNNNYADHHLSISHLHHHPQHPHHLNNPNLNPNPNHLNPNSSAAASASSTLQQQHRYKTNSLGGGSSNSSSGVVSNGGSVSPGHSPVGSLSNGGGGGGGGGGSSHMTESIGTHV